MCVQERGCITGVFSGVYVQGVCVQGGVCVQEMFVCVCECVCVSKGLCIPTLDLEAHPLRPRGRHPHGQTDTCENLAPNLVCGR